MSRLDSTPPVTALSQESLVDLPLRSEEEFLSSPSRRESWRGSQARAAAALGARAGAFAADIATILLLGAAAVLGAGVATGGLPSSAGLPWGAAFALLLSFFTTVPPLVLFGGTVGMALAGLTARSGALGRRLRAGEATRRWLGTLVTAATLGAALLLTVWSSDAPTPADRLSGRTLVDEDVEG